MARPRITLKLATSLDGKIATASGESRWITNAEMRAEAHWLRAHADAVMVGAGTVRADDPELTARTEPPTARQPLRVVLNSALDLKPGGKLFETLSKAKLLFIGAEDAEPERRRRLETAGAATLLVKRSANGLDIEAALELLSQRNIANLLVEGGGRLAASLLGARAIDRIEWMRAPLVIGAEGRPAIAELALSRLADAPRWRRVALRTLGSDLWESYERA
jgi:diaminohydroxyphosphoribosylaminopyrimidine deaminase/5-amino-6-(5-phosphoribosylamino)uracil reductase